MFQKTDLGRLLAVDAAPAISMFLPTHTAGREIRQDAIRFRNLLSKATDALIEKHGLRRPDAENLLKPATMLLDNGDFWRRRDRGLALFIADGIVQRYQVPVELPEEVSIGKRFAVRPLLPLLADDGNFMILAASAGFARLYSATRFGIAEEEADLPKGVAEIDDETDYDKNALNSAPSARAGDRRGNSVGMVKTHSFGDDPEELRKAHLISYLGRLSAAVDGHLRNANFTGPLVLVAEDEIQGHFRKDTHPRALIEKGVSGNPDALAIEDLHRRAYGVVKPMFERSRHAALENFRAISGDPGTAERALTRIEDIVHAARDGRVNALLMVGGEKSWGRYSEEYDRYFAHHGPVEGAVDLLECAATETLMRGGHVHVVEKADLPGNAAAILRF